MAAGIDEIIAVGVNCVSSVEAADLVATAVEASRKPGVVYPNSGEEWDPVARTWRGTVTTLTADVPHWVADGARLVGGCCRVRPGEIAAMGEWLGR